MARAAAFLHTRGIWTCVEKTQEICSWLRINSSSAELQDVGALGVGLVVARAPLDTFVLRLQRLNCQVTDIAVFQPRHGVQVPQARVEFWRRTRKLPWTVCSNGRHTMSTVNTNGSTISGHDGSEHSKHHLISLG